MSCVHVTKAVLLLNKTAAQMETLKKGQVYTNKRGEKMTCLGFDEMYDGYFFSMVIDGRMHNDILVHVSEVAALQLKAN